MFSGEFKEKDQTEVELPEKSCQDVSEMIRFIHPGFGDDLEGGVDSAFRLLPIANEYQIEKLKDKCEDVLKSLFHNVEIILFIFKFLKTTFVNFSLHFK
jgi:hypothetical protein